MLVHGEPRLTRGILAGRPELVLTRARRWLADYGGLLDAPLVERIPADLRP